MKNDVIFPNQSEPVFSWSRVKVWVSWSDPQMCWWNACNLICGSNCRSDLIWISWTAVWSPLVKRALYWLEIQLHRHYYIKLVCSLIYIWTRLFINTYLSSNSRKIVKIKKLKQYKTLQTNTNSTNGIVSYWRPKCKFSMTVFSSNIKLTLP